MFGQELGAEYDSKDKAKAAIFEVLFAGNGYHSPMKTEFTKLFPTIAQVFQVFKRGNKTILPRLLQLLEAYIILQVVTRRIAKEKHNSVPLFTVHDSIVTTEQYAGYVRDVMQEELTRLVGIPPTLKEEVWSEENANILLAELEKKATAVPPATPAGCVSPGSQQ